MELHNLVKYLLSDGSENMSTKLEKMNLSQDKIEEIDTLLKTMKNNIDSTEEVVKFDDNGQWYIKKAIKPGPPLDYSTFNKPTNEVRSNHDRNADTIDYSDPKNITVKKPWTGTADKVKQVRAELDRKSKMSALESMQDRGQIKPKV